MSVRALAEPRNRTAIHAGRTPQSSALTDRIWPRMVTWIVSRKKISTTVYITPEQDARLKALHVRTKVPVAEYIRQGIDLVLEKYRDQLPGQADLNLGPTR
jgi:hypothetical protein